MKIDLHNKWMNDSVVLAQIAHVLGGYGITLTAAYLGKPEYALVTGGLMVAYAAAKEFWYDANFEIPKQTTFDNALDFSMYCVGIALALAVVYV